MSRTGYIIRYDSCPIGCYSESQIDISLSTAETEYVRNVIHLMTLVEELSDIFPLYITRSDLHCKVFEDNQSCIDMTKSSNLSPRTKQIALKYHHFKSYVDSKWLRIIFTRSEDQLADIITKPLPDGQFHILRKVLNG